MGWLYLLLLFATLIFIAVRGGFEERLLTGTMLAASLGTFLLYRAGLRFDAHPLPFIAVSLVHLAISMVVALRSARFWPLVYTALQIATLLSLTSPFFGRNLLSYALGVMQTLWAYPQLFILVLASIRTRGTTSRAP